MNNYKQHQFEEIPEENMMTKYFAMKDEIDLMKADRVVYEHDQAELLNKCNMYEKKIE